MTPEEEKKKVLVNDVEVSRFITKIVEVNDPGVPELYEDDHFSLPEILEAIRPYTTLFDGKSLYWFQTWRIGQQLPMNRLKDFDLIYLLKPQYREEAALASKMLRNPWDSRVRGRWY